MKAIAFACPEEGPSFDEIFPGAPNTNFKIADEDRARYHALAVISGNFASYLWNETAKEFGAFGVKEPDNVLGNYFSSIVARFAESPQSSMTGPLARRDRLTAGAPAAAWAGVVLIGDGELVPLPGGRKGWHWSWWQLTVVTAVLSAIAAARGAVLRRRQRARLR